MKITSCVVVFATLVVAGLVWPAAVVANEAEIGVELMKIQAGMSPKMTSLPKGQYTLRPGGNTRFTFLPSQKLTIRTRFEVTWNTDFFGGGGLNPVDLTVRLRNADGRIVRTVRARSPLRLSQTIERQTDNRRWTIEVVNPHNPVPGIENLRISVGAAP